MRQGVLGRECEVEAGAAFLNRLGPGPVALVYAGEPGIGKTTLWTEAVEQARARSFVVLAARPVQAEDRLAFAALSDLLEPVADDLLPALPVPQQRAIAVALLREDPDDRRLDQHAIGAGTATIVKALARSAPVVVAVDDLQWLDPSSARVLEFALRRLEGLPVAIIAAQRTGDPSRVPLDLERALPQGRVTRVKVGPLGLAVLHGLIKLRLGRSFPRPTLLRIEQATAGNPFFALEIARSLPEAVDPGSPFLPVPDDLAQLVQTRVAGLPAPTRKALLAAAAVPSPTVDLVAGAVERTRSQALVALERAANAGIVRLDRFAVRFSHPLFVAAVYACASPADRRRLHARLAQLTGELEERARHLALAAETPDEAIAAVVADAAEHARRRGAPDTAASLADQARLLTPPDQVEHVLRRTIQAAEYQFHGGRLRQARQVLEAVLEQTPVESLRTQALRLLGEILFHQSSFREATGLFEEALELAGNDCEVRAMIEMHLAFAANAAGDVAGAGVHARRALELAEPLGAEGGLAEALAVSVMVDYMLGRGLDEAKIERALELEDPDRQVTAEIRPSLIAGFLMLYEGRLARSVGILGRLRERILERGQESDLPFLLSTLAWAQCWQGSLQAAAARCEESLECAERVGGAPLRCWSLGFSAVAAAYAGERDQATARAEECRELAGRVGLHIGMYWAAWALALLALSQGDAQAAEAALEPLLPMFEERGVPEPIVGFFLPDAIEALIALGRVQRAERLLAQFEEGARRLGRGWALMAAGRCRALLQCARGDLSGAAATAHEALAEADTIELRLEVARTLLVAGQIERRCRSKQAARKSLERALEIFEYTGARLWADKTREELGRTGLRRARPGDLTEAERRVAELAASGLTNREVAAKLFMSPKTVEANLARVYRKLDIHSRAELGARLGGTPAQGHRETPDSSSTTAA
jgi:DNA-binding CsgD family transcriptional regulator